MSLCRGRAAARLNSGVRHQGEIVMAHQVTWFKDEATWQRYKDICEDKEQFGPSYAEWVTEVERKIAEVAAQHGINLEKIETDPEKFLSWCKANGHPMNGRTRGLYLAQSFTGDDTHH